MFLLKCISWYESSTQDADLDTQICIAKYSFKSKECLVHLAYIKSQLIEYRF